MALQIDTLQGIDCTIGLLCYQPTHFNVLRI